MPNLSYINFFSLKSFRINFRFAVFRGFQSSFMLQFLSWVKFAFKISFVGIIQPFVLSVEQKDEAGELWAFLVPSPALGVPPVPAESTPQPEEPPLASWDWMGLGFHFQVHRGEVLNVEWAWRWKEMEWPLRKLRKARGYFLCTLLVLIKYVL